MKTHRFLLFAGILVTVLNVNAQNATKIGLTLSGGGAKGLAHIGILKAIDSAGLKIDMVTGTSMGSIVGGLYAAGYSGERIEELAREVDWKMMLSNSVSMQSYIMEEKSEYGKYAIELAAYERRVNLPTGFLESQELWMKLQELFYPVSYIKDFDSLPIPFRCIATDLANGNAVVLKDGDIVSAIRASMAIPGIFSAVDRGDQRFVDGGVVRNFPVRDAIEMGATYTIGISVSSPLSNVQKLDNPIKILNQVVFLNENTDRMEEAKLCNLLIDIPMGDYTSASFGRAREIIELGIETGRIYYPYFKKLADSLNHIVQPTEGANEKLLKEKILITELTVNGIKSSTKKSFFEQMELKTPGEYSSGDISSAIRKAFAYRMYKKINYTLQPAKDSGYIMAIQATPEAQKAFKAAIHYNSFTGFSVIGNLTLRNVITPASRTMLSLNIGDNFRGLAEHQQLFGYSESWSNRTRFYTEFQEIPFHQDFKQTGEYKIKYFTLDNLFLNSARRKWSAGLGVRWELIDAKSNIQSGNYYDGTSRFFTLYAAMHYNTFERPFFQTRGTKIDFNAGYVFGLNPNISIYLNGNYLGNVKDLGIGYNDYFRINLNAKRIASISKRWAGLLHLQSGINFGPDQSFLNNFIVGGMTDVVRNQINFSGLREGKLTTESAVTGMAGLRWNLIKDGYITLTGNALYYDFIKKSIDAGKEKWIGGTGLTLGYNLPIGPIEYTIMFGGKGVGWSTYLNFGFPFKAQ